MHQDFRNFIGFTKSVIHSAKGTTWKDHKYIIKKDDKYYYPDSYDGGRHASNLNNSEGTRKELLSWKDKKEESKNSEEKTDSKSKNNNLSQEEIEKLAKEVIRGNYGNGQDRKDALGDDYQQIQDRVNEILQGSSKSNTKITEVDQKEVEKVSKQVKSSGGISLDTVYREKDKKKNK